MGKRKYEHSRRAGEEKGQIEAVGNQGLEVQQPADLQEDEGRAKEVLEYRIGSPYHDVDEYIAWEKVERQYEIARGASTAGSLFDAVDTTLRAYEEAESENSDLKQYRERVASRKGPGEYIEVLGREEQGILSGEQAILEAPQPKEEVEEATDDIDVVDTSTPTKFGTFAHEAYGVAADSHFENVDLERPVRVEKTDEDVRNCYVDVVVNERYLFDFKTGDMREWDEAQARRQAHEDGRQVQEYVHSPDTPADSRGVIIRTVPSASEAVRNAYAETLWQYKVVAAFSETEQPESVIKRMEEVLKAIEQTELDEEEE